MTRTSPSVLLLGKLDAHRRARRHLGSLEPFTPLRERDEATTAHIDLVEDLVGGLVRDLVRERDLARDLFGGDPAAHRLRGGPDVSK